MADQVVVGGVSIEIPAPAGFVSITDEETIFGAWQSDGDPTASLLAGFMSAGDYTDWKQTRDFYWGYSNALVNVDHGFEFLDANEQLLSAFRDKSKKYLPEAFPEAFSDIAQSTLNPELRPGEVGFVKFIEKPGGFIFVQLRREGEDNDVVAVTTTLLVKNRIIGTIVDSSYGGKSKEIVRLVDIAGRWMEQIRNAND